MHIRQLSKNKYVITTAVILFWLVVWQLCSNIIASRILFASPLQVVEALWQLVRSKNFWEAILFSTQRIAAGFFLALVCGILLAILSAVSHLFRLLLTPLIRLMKAVPVVSFVILALLWIASQNLSILIAFVMVLPVIYTNVLQGIDGTDEKLLEMASVFRMSFLNKVRYIYIPSVLPALVSACSVSLGFCWKSGIAAEVIGLPTGSIGEKLYEAKLYLMTGELFAWTAVIVLVSVVFEKLVMFLIRKLAGQKPASQPKAHLR